MDRIVAFLSAFLPPRLLGPLVIVSVLALAIGCGTYGNPASPSATPGVSGGSMGSTPLSDTSARDSLSRRR